LTENQKSVREKIKSGFTLRSILALVIASAIFLPVNTFLSMISGASVANASVYIIAILFVEFSLLLGAPMTKQEIFIVYIMAGLASGGAMAGLGAGTAVFLNYIFRGYYVNSFLTRSFIDPYTHKPLTYVIPDWWAPPYGSDAYLVRSFFHWEWIIPILITTIQFGVFWILQEMALAMISSKMFIETLPFPFADVNAQLVTTLIEREERRMRYFTLSTLAGAIYGMLVFGVPIMSIGMFNVPLQLIPIPWIDLTAGYYGVEQFMPGAAFGIATDPLTWITGFLFPLPILAYMMIGSLACWTFGNWLALTSFKNFFPLWSTEWSKGMNLSLVWQRSYLRVWAFPQVGFVLALAALTLLTGYKTFVAAFKSTKTTNTQVYALGFPSNKVLLSIYFAASGASVALFQWLVPGFPVWMSALTIPAGLAMAIVGTRARGETGQMISIPYLWQGMILLSGYPRVDPFFISPTLGGASAPLWVEGIKTAILTETKPMDFFKAYILTVVLYHVFSFIYVSFFWAIAPIPSSQYPYTLIYWPIQVISQNVWVSRQIATNASSLLYSFLGMTLIGVIGQLITRFTRIPFSFVGLVTGTTLIPPYPVAMFLGGLLGRYGLSRLVGKEKFDAYKSVIVAGIATGSGIVAGIAGAIVVMYKSIWILPF